MRRHKKGVLHHVFLFFLITVLPVFIYKEFQLLSAKKDGGMPTKEDFYTTNPKADMDKKFVVIIPSGNATPVSQLFSSIFDQRYQNFRVVYIDSTRNGQARQWVEKHERSSRVKIIPCQNMAQGCKAYYDEVMACDDQDIIVHLEGDDWLAHPNVFTRINTAYMSQDCMLTYGQYLEYPSYQKGKYKPRPKRNQYKKRVHRAPWVTSHLKTYYASLFKHASKEPTPEYFLTLESEKSLILPLAELGKNHVRFIPEVLYIHNNKSHHRTLKLADMGESIAQTMTLTYDADLLLISEGSPEKLTICLESIKRHLQQVNKIDVLYEETPATQKKYLHLQKKYPTITFTPCASTLKTSLLKNIAKKSEGYIVLTTDSTIMKSDITLKECIQALERTKSYAFYFDLGKKRATSRLFEEEAVTVPRSFREAGIYSWFMEKGQGSFRYPNNLTLTLYRRQDLAKELAALEFDTPATLVDAWSKVPLAGKRGLFFDVPRTFRIK